MRHGSLAFVAALAAAIALLSATPGGGGLVSGCPRAVPGAPAGLPAAVVLTTGCGRYEVAPSGSVHFLGGRVLPVPVGSSWFMDLTWYRFGDGHLLVGRGHRFLWRSHERFAQRRGDNVGAVVLSRNRVAFSFFTGDTPTLYLARLGGVERPVTRGESPLGWTRTGSLLTVSGHGGVIRLRSEDGRFERVLTRSTYNIAFDRSAGALVYVARGRVELFAGRRTETLAVLHAFGLGRHPQLTPLPGTVVVSSSRRLFALRLNGTVLASTVLPRGRAHADWAPGALAADAAGDIAFTATRGNTAYGSTGWETVYLLRPGASAARPIFRRRVQFAVCERAASLAWRGSWLLYSASEGYAAAVDTARPGRFVELSPLVHRLRRPTGDDIFSAEWNA